MAHDKQGDAFGLGLGLALSALLAVGASLSSCADGRSEWRELSLDELAPEEATALEQARTATGALKGRLLEALGGALGRGGPAGAIAVCREEAPALAAAIAKEQGVRIGRTSEKLRQARNVPPPWAEASVAAKRGTPAAFRGPAGEFALLEPLRIAPLCLACHGGAEQIDPLARAKLRELYPEDRATGYALEQLRGYVWVEVPAAP